MPRSLPFSPSPCNLFVEESRINCRIFHFVNFADFYHSGIIFTCSSETCIYSKRCLDERSWSNSGSILGQGYFIEPIHPQRNLNIFCYLGDWLLSRTITSLVWHCNYFALFSFMDWQTCVERNPPSSPVFLPRVYLEQENHHGISTLPSRVIYTFSFPVCIIVSSLSYMYLEYPPIAVTLRTVAQNVSFFLFLFDLVWV